jgi:penicillin-binding protein 1C
VGWRGPSWIGISGTRHARLFWHLDDAFVGSTEHLHQVQLRPDTGRHVVTVVDEGGATVRRAFTVVE